MLFVVCSRPRSCEFELFVCLFPAQAPTLFSLFLARQVRWIADVLRCASWHHPNGAFFLSLLTKISLNCSDHLQNDSAAISMYSSPYLSVTCTSFPGSTVSCCMIPSNLYSQKFCKQEPSSLLSSDQFSMYERKLRDGRTHGPQEFLDLPSTNGSSTPPATTYKFKRMCQHIFNSK